MRYTTDTLWRRRDRFIVLPRPHCSRDCCSPVWLERLCLLVSVRHFASFLFRLCALPVCSFLVVLSGAFAFVHCLRFSLPSQPRLHSSPACSTRGACHFLSQRLRRILFGDLGSGSSRLVVLCVPCGSCGCLFAIFFAIPSLSTKMSVFFSAIRHRGEGPHTGQACTNHPWLRVVRPSLGPRNGISLSTHCDILSRSNSLIRSFSLVICLYRQDAARTERFEMPRQSANIETLFLF